MMWIYVYLYLKKVSGNLLMTSLGPSNARNLIIKFCYILLLLLGFVKLRGRINIPSSGYEKHLDS